MSDWYPAPCLLTLRDELNTAYPTRDTSSDGIIGDPRHQAEVSDHNPDPHSLPPDCVRAIDLDNDGALGEATPLVRDVLRATVGDPRVWYVIWDGKISSLTYGWAWRIYTGASRHEEHLHVSLRGPRDGLTEEQAHTLAFDTSPWLGGGGPVAVLPAVKLHRIREAARYPHRAVAPTNVKRVQRALAARQLLTPTRVTGIYGSSTRTAVARFQRSLGYTGADATGILGVRSGTLLGADRYRLLP